jgi:2-desacetyl-2-hydroxyethyl bacteriochlorophyllide A dehydrogenase
MTVLGEHPQRGASVVMTGVGAPLHLVERPVTPPAPGEAVVQVDACGVCGSDVFLHEGGFGADKLPRVPGHEAAGRVVAVGSKDDADWVGCQVALYYIDAPPESVWARAGHENIGPEVVRMGVDVDGAFAEYVTRPIRTLIRVHPPMDAAAVAVATDALATPYHALTAVGRLQAGETVIIIGLGGVGSNAVQIAKHLGANVVAVGRGEAKMELARKLGADVLVRSRDGAAAIRAAAGGQADMVLQCVGDPAMDRLAIDVAGFRARVVLIGSSLGGFELASTDLIWRELTVLGSRGFTRADIQEVLELVRSGALDTAHLVDRCRPLSEAAEAIEDLRSGRVMRTLLVNGSTDGHARLPLGQFAWSDDQEKS